MKRYIPLFLIILATLPASIAMAEETATNDWVMTWSEKADTIAANAVVVMINTDDELSPLMVKVAVKELATGTKHEIAVSKDAMSKATVGDIVTVLQRSGHCTKKDVDGSVKTCLAFHPRYEISVVKKRN